MGCGMRLFLATATTLALAACGDVSTPATPDAGELDAPIVEPDAAPDPDALVAPCDVTGLPPFAPVPIVEQQIAPSLTAAPGETINDTLGGTLKRHYLVVPGAGQPRPERALLWLAGSGAEPYHFTKVLGIAAAAGYVGISLAYDNEVSVGDLCSSTTVLRCNNRINHTCGDEVRHELLYGDGVYDSPCLVVPRADSIEHRAVRLVQYLDGMFPMLGAAQFLDGSGTGLAWHKWAIGGWSQGGGHAGILAREHLVARALYLSKGGDSVPCPFTTADPDRDCDVDGDGVFDSANLDELLIPAPDTFLARRTPGERQFGAVHEAEAAWGYSGETFEAYGMGAEADTVRVDGLTTYDQFQCRNVFSTVAVPASDPNDFHISMAVDGAMAVDGNGVPVLAPMIFYALAVPVR